MSVGSLKQGQDYPNINREDVDIVELRTSSTKGKKNLLQTCNILYYYLNYFYYIKQLDIEQ